MLENIAPQYYVWGTDRISYGPVELPTLVHWIREERVVRETWVFAETTSAWTQAGDLAEAKAVFKIKPAGGAPVAASIINPAALRRVKIFAGLDDKVLESLLRYMAPVEVPAFAVLVRPGEPADAMYFILRGELRAYVLLDGKESTLATLLPGETFGEIALLDGGERTAFVAANQPSQLLKLSDVNFAQIVREAPALAAPFSLGLARTLAARLRHLDKRYEDSIRFSRTVASHG